MRWVLPVVLGCCCSAGCARRTPPPPSCIDEALVEGMFKNIRQKGKWAIDGPMLWGYFFVDRDRAGLARARSELERRGYRFVQILESNGKDDPLILHVERIEVHSVDLSSRTKIEGPQCGCDQVS
jgi:hypothetical protein